MLLTHGLSQPPLKKNSSHTQGPQDYQASWQRPEDGDFLLSLLVRQVLNRKACWGMKGDEGKEGESHGAVGSRMGYHHRDPLPRGGLQRSRRDHGLVGCGGRPHQPVSQEGSEAFYHVGQILLEQKHLGLGLWSQKDWAEIQLSCGTSSKSLNLSVSTWERSPDSFRMILRI